MNSKSPMKARRFTVRALIALASVLSAAMLVAPGAQAAFGFESFDLTFNNQNGTTSEQAGSHPFSVNNRIRFNVENSTFGEIPSGQVKDLNVNLPTGFVGDPTAVPRCSNADFINFNEETKIPQCSNSTAVGTVIVKVHVGGQEHEPGLYIGAPVYNLVPPPGVVQKLGFIAFGVPVPIEFIVNPEPPYNVIARLANIAQPLPFIASNLTIWGNPASPAHDEERGNCIFEFPNPNEEVTHFGSCPANVPEKPFITLPRACAGPLSVAYSADPWEEPGHFLNALFTTHDSASPPNPLGFSGCGKLRFNPTISAVPTTKAAESPTGLEFSLNVADEGLTSPTGVAQSDIRKAEVTLPEGFTTNPSLAEGLNVCTEADLARETLTAEPGEGCPSESKIGTVEVDSPLLEEPVDGSLFIAKPYENQAGNSLLGLYLVVRNRTLGIIIKQPLKVEPNAQTGQLTTVAEEIPQLPFSHFKLHFREGTRSPLASPPLCGEYAAKAVLTPWAGGAPVTTNSMFTIISGPNAGACPTGGTPPFHPGLEAGTINNAAGSYSPFYVHLTRNDGEQEITHFSIKLPPGVVGKLAGVPFCSNADIAAAAARTGNNGGQEEIEHPSCPTASEIGHTLVGAGVGPTLAYAPGKVYLAGPYHGSNLSIVAITAAKVGPFDLGTVVVRQALKINPETAEVFIDATGSDPLPHIIKGIPVHLRDIRVYIDRPEFVLNPTSCERTSTASTVLGSGTNFASESDDRPITVTTPFQAASCASLGFEPKLALSLKGGTKRSGNPSFKAVVTARKGDANIGKARVTLPHSEFLEQGHIKTVCTRVQFNAGGGNGEQCPAASIYGRARATTPLLSEPLAGPVYLRSSSHRLPDLVAALHSGEINIDLDGRIDSAKGGRIRNTFEAVPDAPVNTFTLEMFGGKKSLLVNSTDLCKGTHRAISEFTGQNGKVANTNPVVKAQCKKAKKHAKGKK